MTMSYDQNLEYAREQHEASIHLEASRKRQEEMRKIELEMDDVTCGDGSFEELEALLDELQEQLDELCEEEMEMIADGFKPWSEPKLDPELATIEFCHLDYFNESLDDLPF